MHWLVLSVPQDQHAQQLELLFSGRTRSTHLSHFHKDNTTKFELFVMVAVLYIIMPCFPACKIQNQQIRIKQQVQQRCLHISLIPSFQDSEPTNKIQIISTTKMPTHLTDSQLARFRTNPIDSNNNKYNKDAYTSQ